MKRTIKLLFIVFMQICILFAGIIGNQEPRWKGKIEYENGVKVIRNPKEPLYKEAVLHLEEELSIGKTEGKKEYMFSFVQDISVDDEERIYVLDRRESHIQVFDGSGKHIRTIGRKGQGPGEIQNPFNIHISPQKQIIVNDAGSRRLLFFAKDGKFIKQLSLAKMPLFQYPEIDSEGTIYGSLMILGLKPRTELRKYNSNLDLISVIASIEYPNLPTMNPFMPLIYWGVINGDSVIWGIPTKYELQTVNSEGKVIEKIIRDYDPIKITEIEKEEMKRYLAKRGYSSIIKIEIPKYHLAYKHISFDDEGKIILGTYEKAKDGESYYYDVFDSEGKYIAKIPLRIQPLIWKENKLYTIEEDEEGFQVVKKYKIIWKGIK